MARPVIPTTLEELTPEWLSGVLPGDARVASVRCEPLGEGEGFVGQLARLHLAYEGEAGAAPRTVIAKLPTTVRANRATGELLGVYEREILFYRELAPEVSYRTARLYHAEMDDNPASAYGPAIVRFVDRLPTWLMRPLMALFYLIARASGRRYVLMLEDLAPARLGDQVAGASAEACRPVVRAMARAQAALWQSPRLEGRYWVSALDIGLRLGREMFRGSRAGFEERFAKALRPEDHQALDWLDRHIVDLQRDLMQRAPDTLLHGDFRLDNLFFDERAEPLVVDWQSVARGPGVLDLAYFVSGSLPPETSDDDELALVRAYHEALVAEGVTGYALDACLRDYRSAVVLLLARIVTIDWVDLGDERGALLIDRWVDRILARLRGIDRDALLPPPALPR